MSAFDPSSYPQLVELGSRLRELAGDAAYQAGRDYFRKGLVKQAAVGGTTAYASVSGSTDYRVSVGFGSEAKVSCTCPAHRRNKFCKHVVAVCTALTEQPGSFAEVEAAPEPPVSKERKPRAPARKAGPDATELRAAGLATIERLLEDLAADGLMGLGADKSALLENAGELVRALKLRRLGTLLLGLQRAASGRGRALEADQFAGLLVDLWITYQASAAHLNGESELDPLLAEDLIGKTWRAEELEPITAPMQSIEVAFESDSDGEFAIQSSYLADLESSAIYVDRQITPRQRTAPKPRHRHRLCIEEAALYPGLPPRRIRLARWQQAPLSAADVGRLIDRAETSVAEMRRRLAERGQVPFGAPPETVLFCPTELVALKGQLGAIDRRDERVLLDWPNGWKDELPGLLPNEPSFALFGRLHLTRDGLLLRCLSVVSSELKWGRGPVYPDV